MAQTVSVVSTVVCYVTQFFSFTPAYKLLIRDILDSKETVNTKARPSSQRAFVQTKKRLSVLMIYNLTSVLALLYHSSTDFRSSCISPEVRGSPVLVIP